MNLTGMRLWFGQSQFWETQAALCGVRRDIYRTLARNCELPFLGSRPLQGIALYCQMQAGSCELQGHFCRMLATLLL